MIFKLDMIPPTVTGQMHKVGVRNGKPFFYDTPEIKDARQKMMAYLYQYRPSEPLDGPVALITTWLYPIKGKHTHMEYRTSRPDTDNLQKLLKDCMTECGFWKDDAQVAWETIEKRWVDPEMAGIAIAVFDADKGEQYDTLRTD
jgi:Holliday junction resolvase RusA-like endonuclease